MAPQEPQQLEIVSGPNLHILSIALTLGNSNNRYPVTMEVTQGGWRFSAQFVINAIEREDGSGESWLIKGTRITDYAFQGHDHTDDYVPFTGYFSTKTRKGHLREEPR